VRILFLTHSFNSLTQRLFVELTARGHEVSVEFDIHDAVTEEAVELFRPDVILAPYLRRRIPESVWRRNLCLVVHPGIPGDRGPSALDWAIMNRETEWGVTVLQAIAELDAGPIWAQASFPMRLARKSSLYRNEVTEAAVAACLRALERVEAGGFRPERLAENLGRLGRARPAMRQADRAIDWRRNDTETVLRKIHAADGSPGVLDALFGEACYLYDAWPEDSSRGAPGEILARRDGAILRATADGAVWLGSLRRKPAGEPTFKLPAALALAGKLGGVPDWPVGLEPASGRTYQDIRYEERGPVGYLDFDFYNGAMSTEQCRRLLQAYEYARARPTRVIVLLGGRDFWSNGMHLNVIEAAESPADESWNNINAMDDLVRALITTDRQVTIAALQGNAGAGGAFLALAADRVYARESVVLNPHYKGMGNLYGSEYWTYLLPRRVAREQARVIIESRLPIGARAARAMGFVDDCFETDAESFLSRVRALAEGFTRSPDYERLMREKRERRARDEREKPLEAYRAEELEHMKLNFCGFDPSYHVARYNFVYKVPHSWTPSHLACHRRGQTKRSGKSAGPALDPRFAGA
jgi:putative two-component system hydrogenase maturation factor HypX/HoxX